MLHYVHQIQISIVVVVVVIRATSVYTRRAVLMNSATATTIT